MQKKTKIAVILGASGLVGGDLLAKLLDSDAYSEVIALVRKDLGINHPKLKVCSIDFDNLAKYKALIVGDDMFCCLGTTIAKAGSQDAFRRVDYQYPIQFAQIAKENDFKQYLIVSSIGANANSSVFYLKTKGECEDAISEIGLESFSIFRPASLLGDRKESRLNEKITLPLLKALSFLLIGKLRKYRPIEASKVAESMLRIAQKNNRGVTIYESDEINETTFS